MMPSAPPPAHVHEHARIVAAAPRRPCAVSERTCTDGVRIAVAVQAPVLTRAEARAIALRVRACFPAVSSYFTTAPVRIVVGVDEAGIARTTEFLAGADPNDDSLAGGTRRSVLDPACAPWPMPASLRGQPARITLRVEDCCSAIGDFDELPNPPTGGRPR